MRCFSTKLVPELVVIGGDGFAAPAACRGEGRMMVRGPFGSWPAERCLHVMVFDFITFCDI